MSKLLWANFFRLRRSGLFWAENIILAAVVVLSCIDQYHYMGTEAVFDGFFFGYVWLVGMPLPIFSGLFLGTEYGDGTMRNKLIAGNKRSAVYLANLITVFTVSLVMSFLILLIVCVLGIPLFGPLLSDAEIVMVLFLESLLTLLAYSAIYTLIGHLIQNKAFMAVATILIAFFLFAAAMSISDRLKASEFYDADAFSENDWDMGLMQEEQGGEMTVAVINPHYLTEQRRAVYEFLYDLIPFGQAHQISNMFEAHPKHLLRIPLCSLLIILGTTGSGLYLFGRKDIK